MAALETKQEYSFLRNAGCFVFITTLMLIAAPALKAQTFPYVLHDLGTLEGTSSYGKSINNRGQVAGYSTTSAGVIHGFLSGPNGSGPLQDLGTLGGTKSFCFGLNDSGQAVGHSQTPGLPPGPSVAFISAPNGGVLQSLGNLGGINSRAYAINASGQVVGYADTTTGGLPPHHAFLSGPNGGELIDLGTLGGSSSVGYGVNASGQVTGTAAVSVTSPADTHAFLSGPNGGTLRDLGTMGGTFSDGYAVNAIGQVTGSSPTLPGNIPTHAFLSAPNGGALTDLGTLGGTYSEGLAVDDQGAVVGESSTSADAATHAFLYTSASGMRDLNFMIKPGSGLILNYATGINIWGQISGFGTNSAGQTHAFLLTPSYLESFNMGIKEAALAGNIFTVKIPAFKGHTYQLQRSVSLDPAAASWQDVGAAFVAGSDQLLSLQDTNVTGETMFYRVKLTR